MNCILSEDQSSEEDKYAETGQTKNLAVKVISGYAEIT